MITDITRRPDLVLLRSEALALIPARHADGDVAWVEMTETLRHDQTTHTLTPAKIAQVVTQSLDQAAYEWELERDRS